MSSTVQVGEAGPRSFPSVVFLCMAGRFSLPPLQLMLAAGVEIRALVAPGDPSVGAIVSRAAPAPSGLPVLRSVEATNAIHLAWERGIPVYEAGNLAAKETIELVHGLEPGVIAVACFPRLIPQAFRSLARLGCLNVHPSLLPDNRGPEPIFWSFRRGDADTGVTVHLAEDRADSGPIFGQMRVSIAQGVAGEDLEETCARVGGDLLVQALSDLAAGRADPRPQNEKLATYFPQPRSGDFLLDPSWPAKRAFNFVRGVGYLNGPLAVGLRGRAYRIRRALAFEESGALQAASVFRSSNELWLQCNPGVLKLELQHE